MVPRPLSYRRSDKLFCGRYTVDTFYVDTFMLFATVILATADSTPPHCAVNDSWFLLLFMWHLNQHKIRRLEA